MTDDIKIDDNILLKAEGYGGDGHIAFSKLIEEMQHFKDVLPLEVRDTAFVRLNCYGDASVAYLHFGRAKTRAEIEEDRQYWDNYRAKSNAELEARERAELKRLKAKFEGG